MTGITEEGFDVDRDFAAPPATVFGAWTSAESFAHWFGGRDVKVVDVDYVAKVGNTWTAQMILPDGNTIDWAGKFVEIEPNTRFVLTMTDRPAEPTQLAITVDFTETPTGTHMTMSQAAAGFSTEQREATIAGWQQFFDAMEDVLAG